MHYLFWLMVYFLVLVIAIFVLLASLRGKWLKDSRMRNRELTILNQALEKSNLELEETRKQLELKVAELERFTRNTIGRELKMIELKQKIKELEERVKKG